MRRGQSCGFYCRVVRWQPRHIRRPYRLNLQGWRVNKPRQHSTSTWPPSPAASALLHGVQTTRCYNNKKLNYTPWPESASKLYRPSDRRLSAKLVLTFADRGCHVVSLTDPYSRILGFLDRSRYFYKILLAESKEFWRWCRTPKIAGFLYFVHRPEF
jgi:hypothetical protein